VAVEQEQIQLHLPVVAELLVRMLKSSFLPQAQHILTLLGLAELLEPQGQVEVLVVPVPQG
jgi:hypothetical protein